MTLQDFLIFSGLAMCVAAIAHAFVRRYWLAVLLSLIVASAVNIVHEAYVHHATIRGGDIIYLPYLLFLGMIAAFPSATLVGIPFVLVRSLIRRRRQSNAA